MSGVREDRFKALPLTARIMYLISKVNHVENP